MLNQVARSTVAVFAIVLAVLLSSARAAAQGSCDVVVQLDDTSPQSYFAFGVDYSATNGEFVGNSTQPGAGGVWDPDYIACTNLAAEFFDALDDKAGTLSLFFADSVGLTGPLALASCVFQYDSGSSCPLPGDFTIVDEAFPDEPFPPPVPFPPRPAVSVASVTPRTAVCGDGFREGPEECDDGNTADGDCCSASCTLDPEGTPCPDASVCTNDELCDGAGTCVVGSTVSCDDGVFCTHDFCDPTAGCLSTAEPTTHYGGCYPFVQSRTVLRDSATDDNGDRMVMRGKSAGSIGDPTVATNYAVCVWDTVAGAPTLAARIDVPAGPPWTAGATGQRFLYRDPTRASDGVEKMRIVRSSKGLVRFLLKGKGGNLPLPGPFDATQYLAQDPNVTVEIENDEGGCWSVTYDDDATHGRVRHKPDGFKAVRSLLWW